MEKCNHEFKIINTSVNKKIADVNFQCIKCSKVVSNLQSPCQHCYHLDLKEFFPTECHVIKDIKKCEKFLLSDVMI
jgi:hypothetical protein